MLLNLENRLPFIPFRDASGGETNIQGKVKGKFFCLFVFARNVPNEIAFLLESFNDLFSVETIAFSEHTNILYKEFGIKKNGCYLIRPDRYIAYRADNLVTKHLQKYISQFLV